MNEHRQFFAALQRKNPSLGDLPPKEGANLMKDVSRHPAASRRTWMGWLSYAAPGVALAIAVIAVGASGVGDGEVMGMIVEWVYAHLFVQGLVMGSAWRVLPALPFWSLVYAGVGTVFFFLVESRPRAWRLSSRVAGCWASLVAVELLLVALLSASGVLTD